MTRRSAKSAQLFGIILTLLICAWDMDAMRPHIAAHSWATLAFVSLYLLVHLSNYVTVGRLIHRLDPLVLTNPIAIPLEESHPSARPAQIATHIAA
jgi:hypothetical protein